MVETPASPAPSALPLQIPADLVDAMLAHCRREAPHECCGLLGGVPPSALSLYPLRNIEASPVRYLADPQELIDAVVALRNRGHEIVAIYHSHPHHAAIPSRTDLAENHYGDVPRIIVSLLDDPPDVRIWQLEPDRYQELPWRRVPPAGG